MPVSLFNPSPTNESVDLSELSAVSCRMRYSFASLLVGLMLASFVIAERMNLLDPSAFRLLVLLFVGQWLVSTFELLKGRTNLFIDRAYYACRAVGVIAKSLTDSFRHRRILKPCLQSEERVSLLFWIVKLIFIPFLLSVASNQASKLVPIFLSGKLLELLSSFSMVYIIWLASINILDTVVATLGYAFESKSLDNQVRSVDTSILAWLSVLCCYPPFLVISNALIPIHASPYFARPIDTSFDVGIRLLIILFLTLFTVSTLNLNVHFSNLCHRGLVSSGLYSIVRHPAYSTKLISWALVLAYLNWANLIVWCHFVCWVAIYVVRAITEERHLSRVDKQYVEYCKRVKYRFIPGLV